MAEQLLNTIINRKYRLLSVLGGGAMGIVYRAAQLDDEGLPLREVALKMIGQQYFLQEPEAVQRFHREVRVAMRLSSPNAVTVYDYGQTGQGALYFTMELIRCSKVMADYKVRV